MTIARVIQTGKTQTVELPEDVRLDTDVVEVTQSGGDILLHPVTGPARKATIEDMLDALAALGELIGDVPEDPPPQERPDL